MEWSSLLREICEAREQERGLSEGDAHALFAALLDGGMPDLELGAALAALGVVPGGAAELLGFTRALNARLAPLPAPAGMPRPVVLPSYGNVSGRLNLLPLVALLLARVGVPVLVHGTLEGSERISTATVLRELGVYPCANEAQVRAGFGSRRLAFVPTGLLSQGLARLIALRGRLGVRNIAHLGARLLDPFAGEGLCVTGASHPGLHQRMRDYFLAAGERALLLRATEGEPFADPRHRPAMELLDSGSALVLFSEGRAAPEAVDAEPGTRSPDARASAAFVRAVLEGAQAVPPPIVHQLACCLYGTGYAGDFNEAKALAALHTRGLAVA